MKMFMASMATETNSFAPIPTGWSSFKEELYTKDASLHPPSAFTMPLVVWRKLAEAEGWDVVESLTTFAQPAGPTIREVYEIMRDDILTDLEAAMPVDVVLLSMHGAMIAEGYDDCEGDLMERVREIVGKDVVIGLEIDPHCHLTEAMLEAANVIICFKEYPHVDIGERAEEVFKLCADAAAGKINPVMRDYDCRMMSMYHTPLEPVRSFVDEMSSMEGQSNILSVSLAHGFPWGDSPRCGTRTLVITDGDAEGAEKTAQLLGEKLWNLRDKLSIGYPDIAGGLDRAVRANAVPVVLADFADNAGGGAPSDSTFVLQAMLDRGIKDVALSLFWDPVLVHMCIDAGVGAQMKVRVGGKIGPMSGDPIDLDVTVRGINRNATQLFGEAIMSFGDSVWLEADGVHIVLNTVRSQTFHPQVFTDLGMDLNTMKVIVVKSSQHFYAAFAPIASEVIHLATPGAITPDFTIIPFTKRDDNYWPKTENPFA